MRKCSLPMPVSGTEFNWTVGGVTASGVTASGVTASGVTAGGVTAGGVTAGGVTVGGVTVGGVTVGGVTVGGVTVGGVTVGGIIRCCVHISERNIDIRKRQIRNMEFNYFEQQNLLHCLADDSDDRSHTY
ncbi:unnamed protein product [Toxocara canis]|uniref:Uncharacterized protein n=1 Tax=Toxocara canis TaxID=6265 RepID=A0A183UHU9_TOXCA|nr:unnamed protein product [Toxocara canis]